MFSHLVFYVVFCIEIEIYHFDFGMCAYAGRKRQFNMSKTYIRITININLQLTEQECIMLSDFLGLRLTCYSLRTYEGFGWHFQQRAFILFSLRKKKYELTLISCKSKLIKDKRCNNGISILSKTIFLYNFMLRLFLYLDLFILQIFGKLSHSLSIKT